MKEDCLKWTGNEDVRSGKFKLAFLALVSGESYYHVPVMGVASIA